MNEFSNSTFIKYQQNQSIYEDWSKLIKINLSSAAMWRTLTMDDSHNQNCVITFISCANAKNHQNYCSHAFSVVLIVKNSSIIDLKLIRKLFLSFVCFLMHEFQLCACAISNDWGSAFFQSVQIGWIEQNPIHWGRLDSVWIDCHESP